MRSIKHTGMKIQVHGIRYDDTAGVCWAEQIFITLERGSEPSGTKYTTVRKRWEWKISCEQADVGIVRKLIIVFSEFLYCRIN